MPQPTTLPMRSTLDPRGACAAVSHSPVRLLLSQMGRFMSMRRFNQLKQGLSFSDIDARRGQAESKANGNEDEDVDPWAPSDRSS